MSAKATIDYGTAGAAIVGYGREKIEEKFYNQPRNETQMDNFNNKIGRELGRRAQEEGWSDTQLALEIKKLLDDNKILKQPKAKPSLLDYYSSY